MSVLYHTQKEANIEFIDIIRDLIVENCDCAAKEPLHREVMAVLYPQPAQ